MKSNKAIKKLTILIIILIVLILVCISFFGVFKRNLNKWENILPEYSFSKEIDGVSSFSFDVDESTKQVEEKNEEEKENDENTEKVDDSVEVGEVISTEETSQNEQQAASEDEKEDTTKTVPVNEDSVKTKDNYIKTKKIIQKRLELFGYSDYNIRLNEDNGKIEVEVPYGQNIESVIELVTNSGKIEIVDSDTNEVLLDNSDIKSVSAYYNKSDSSNVSYTDDSKTPYDLGIQIGFNNDGLKKFQDITKQYVETTGSDGESEIKSITIKVDDEDKYKTYFSLDGNYTYLSFPLYQGVTDDKVMNDDYRECIIVQDAVNAGELPVIYSFNSGTYMNANNKDMVVKVSIVIIIAVVAVISIYFILKNKKMGIFAMLLEIGYIAGLLLIVRFANVTLSVTGLISVLGVSVLNFYFIKLMMENAENRYLLASKKFLFNTIPLIIMMIVFNYSNTLQLKSVGMVMFWGLLISFVYNAIISNILFYCCDKETIKGAGK